MKFDFTEYVIALMGVLFAIPAAYFSAKKWLQGTLDGGAAAYGGQKRRPRPIGIRAQLWLTWTTINAAQLDC